MDQTNHQRRNFLKKAIAFGTAASITPQLLKAMSEAKGSATNRGEGTTFLFQGDSITDGNRSRNNDWNHVMGHGYQYIIASRLWYDFPEKGFDFFNRGISGNKVTDLAARWQSDTLDLRPDVLSVLIGINDTSAFINGNNNFSAEHYERDFRQLLQQTKQQLPAVQIVLCEPFVLPVGNVKTRWDVFHTEVEKRQQVVKKLSEEFNAVFVPLQAAFNKASKQAPADYWIWDGIHPMPAGHELIAREWLHRVNKTLQFIK